MQFALPRQKFSVENFCKRKVASIGVENSGNSFIFNPNFSIKHDNQIFEKRLPEKYMNQLTDCQEWSSDKPF